MRWMLLTLFLPSIGHAADNWPSFRGPHGDGHADAANLPVQFSETQSLHWKTPIPGKGWSSPVIWGNQIWLTTAPPDGKELFAVCLDRQTGKIIHNIRVFAIEKPAFCHAFNSYASSTPVIEQGRVYVHFGSHGTACLDTVTGQILWTRQDLPCDHFRAAGSSPILHQNLLIVNFDGVDVQYVVALDKTTGKTAWKRDRDIDYGTTNPDLKKAYGTPAVIDVNGRLELISPSAGATIAYDPLTGDELWRFQHGGMNAAARPLYGFGTIFLTTGNGGLQLVAIRPDGHGNVTNTHLAWKYARNVPCRCSLLLLGERLLLISEQGLASLVDAKTGKQIGQTLRLPGTFSSSPLFADGRVYACSEDGPVFVLDAADELKLLAANKLDAGCMASPAATGKSLFVRTKGAVYCFEKP